VHYGGFNDRMRLFVAVQKQQYILHEKGDSVSRWGDVNDLLPLNNPNGSATPLTGTVHQPAHEDAMGFQQIISSFGSPSGKVLISMKGIFDFQYFSSRPNYTFPFNQGRDLVFSERISFDRDTPLHGSYSQGSTQLRGRAGVMQTFIPSQQSLDVGEQLN
jgi:hypothetical protein